MQESTWGKDLQSLIEDFPDIRAEWRFLEDFHGLKIIAISCYILAMSVIQFLLMIIFKTLKRHTKKEYEVSRMKRE